MKVGNWEIERARPAGVTGLEIWDVPGSKGEFWRRAGAQFVHARRAEGVNESDIGKELATEVAFVLAKVHAGRHAAPVESARGFSKLYLCGGLTALDGFQEAITKLKLPFAVMFGEGTLGSAVGGRQLLAEKKCDSGAVVDVGQTALKLMLFSPKGEEVRIVARDLNRAPLVPFDQIRSASTTKLIELAHGSIEFIADAISEALESRFAPPPNGVLALPCSLDDELIPGGSTYAHWEGNRGLVPALVRAINQRLDHRARLAQCPWRGANVRLWVLNDAEMAAIAARKAAGREKTLVLTLGYGPGAALVQG